MRQMRRTIPTLAMLLVAASAVAVPIDGLPPAARAALEPAVSAEISRFNEEEDKLRVSPRVIASGPDDEPTMLRAVYRKAGTEHDVISAGAGPTPSITVRFRATEFEKRVTNVNDGDLRALLAKAEWKKSPRGYLVDVTLRWDGIAWTAEGTPVERPTLGVVGRPDLDRALER